MQHIVHAMQPSFEARPAECRMMNSRCVQLKVHVSKAILAIR
jgi:hypothetical protein